MDGSVVIYDEKIDPETIGTITGWTGRYGKRGALRELLFKTLEARAPEYVPTSELALLAIAEFSLVYEHWKLRKSRYTVSLRSALQALRDRAALSAHPRCHSQPWTAAWPCRDGA